MINSGSNSSRTGKSPRPDAGLGFRLGLGLGFILGFRLGFGLGRGRAATGLSCRPWGAGCVTRMDTERTRETRTRNLGEWSLIGPFVTVMVSLRQPRRHTTSRSSGGRAESNASRGPSDSSARFRMPSPSESNVPQADLNIRVTHR
jgi:hypothetical protein